MRILRLRAEWVVLGVVLTLFSGLSLGSAQPEACEAAFRRALATLRQACAAAEANSACLGGPAEASLIEGASGVFARSGDQVSLNQIAKIHTLPMKSADDGWGAALLNVQANVPLALSPLGLRYILLGDVEVENAVDPKAAFVPAPGLAIAPLVAANLRARPSTEGQVLGNAPVGTPLIADGLSADQAWLRVLRPEGVAWISRQIVAATDGGDISSLPVIGSNARTLMQAFYLRTGESAACDGAPPSYLLLQSPGGVNASITVNGADIRFDGALALRTLESGGMQLITLAGGASVGGVSVPGGFTLQIPLDSTGRTTAGSVTGLRPINGQERGHLTTVTNSVPAEVLYQPLSLPTTEQVAALLAQINAGAVGQASAGPASGQADCARFKPTSPLGSLALGQTPFYWDGAPGATAYRLNIYSADGGLRSSFEVSATSTTLTVDTAAGIGDGSEFAWNVQALVNGQIACTSGLVRLPRDAFGQPVSGGGGSPGATPTACTWNC